MKKVLSIILALVAFFSLFSLTACSSEEESEETFARISLSAENYSKYITINIYYADCGAVPSDNDTYDLYCMGHIETSRAANVYFEEVKITFSLPTSVWTYQTPTASLDYIGESHCSFSCTNYFAHDLTFPSSGTVNVKSISGFVLIPR